MITPLRAIRPPFCLVLLLVCGVLCGCCGVPVKHQQLKPLPPAPVPRELEKVSLPAYVIEPPDILLIDAVNTVPKAPYRLAPLDLVFVQVTPTFPENPINGVYTVGPDGSIALGAAYGSVFVAGMGIEEAREAIRKALSGTVREPTVSLTLAQTAAAQRIAGQHLVGPDGTINLGIYGRVYVTGHTINQARQAIERHLGQYLQQPKVSVAVAGYNSKVYYVITEGAGLGDAVTRLPVTGNETVLDAVANIQGLSQVSSKRIWVARPSPAGSGPDQILPVNWVAISKGASTETNYQLFPGDRVFISENPLVKRDNQLAKLLAPIERAFGFTLLGVETIQSINSFPTGIFVNNQ